ncbi:MAG: flagellar biosynthetic protein FliO [Rhodoferax sp.]
MIRLRPFRLAASLLAFVSLAARAVLPTVPAAPAEPSVSHGFAGLLQAGLGLAFVVGLIFLCAWAVRRLGLQPNGGNRLLKVVSSVMVGQRERVVVVEVGDAWLVLGVAAGQVSALHTMAAQSRSDTQSPSDGNANPVTTAFSKTLRDSLSQFGKRGKTH